MVKQSHNIKLTDEFNLLQREERHEDNPVVKCPRCKEEMPLLDTERHMKECATEDNVQCSFCPKAFKKGSFGLHAHMRQIHFWGMFRHATQSIMSRSNDQSIVKK